MTQHKLDFFYVFIYLFIVENTCMFFLKSHYRFSPIFAIITSSLLGRLSTRFWGVAVGFYSFSHKSIN